MARRPTPDTLGEDPTIDGADIVAVALGVPAQVELLYDSYDALPEDDRAVVIDHTAAIKGRKRALEENTLAIGRMLTDVKTRLPYGQFGRWLEQEFAWSQDTAGRLMRIHQVFGGAQIPRIAESGASVLAMLAAPSVPEAAREEFRTRAEAGPVPVKEAKAIVAKHKPAPAAPKVGTAAKSDAPAWKPAPQPEPEPELATPLQQAMLDWARTLPAGQRIFSLKDLGGHKAGSVYWPKAKRFSPVIDRATSSQIADAAHWARLQMLEDNGQAPKPIVVEAEQPAPMHSDITEQIPRIAESGNQKRVDITAEDVCAGLREAFGLPDATNLELLGFIVRRVVAGPGKLVLWHAEEGRRVVRLNDGTSNPPWLDLDDNQAAWLVKELSDE